GAAVRHRSADLRRVATATPTGRRTGGSIRAPAPQPSDREVDPMSLRTALARSVTTAALVAATVAGTAVATAGAAHAATPTTTAAGNYWGAIAFSPRTGNVGYAYDYATAGAASSAASRKCGAGDCRVA